ncbi:MAG TPA: B-box zinc finger protein [Anaerolineales bacterium]|nr:B-box zinc finger protein [Anaerolineales bacterium]
MTEENTTQDQITVCYRHPDRETGLSCNRCGKPICTSCAKRVPTGYRCPDCIKELKKTFDTAQPQDYILGFLVAAALSFVGAKLIGLFSGFGFFLIFFISIIGTGAGALIAEVVRRVIQKRRSRPLFITVAVGVALGGIAANLGTIVYVFFTGNILGGLFSLIWPGIYLFLATTTTYVRLSGIQLNR